MSCGADEAEILTALNSLTPSLVSPPENAISPRRETDYQKTKGSGRGFVTGHLREGRGPGIYSSARCIQHMDRRFKLWLCLLYNGQKQWVLKEGFCDKRPRDVRFKPICVL